MKARLASAAVLSLALTCSAGATAAPARLSDTGLGDASVAAFSPQYPLWSDGASKRRWIALPAGQAIDASDPEAWDFPAGTRLWKEFALDRPVETRFIQRLPDGSWEFAAYVWNEDGSDAVLAPASGLPDLPVAGALDARYAVPSTEDCRACHDGGAVPVLGFSLLQLSPKRDPNAPHAERPPADALDLSVLVERGWLVNLPRRWLDRPPEIAASSAAERAALGYLHGNCGHCHNDSGAGVPVDLPLAQALSQPDTAGALRASLRRHSGRLGAPRADLMLERMRSRDPRLQMPPLGSRLPDVEALALMRRWIRNELQPTKE